MQFCISFRSRSDLLLTIPWICLSHLVLQACISCCSVSEKSGALLFWPCPESVSETSSNQGFTQIGPKNCENAKKRTCDAPAKSCDVFCDACDVFCNALRRFLRRPATSCDALRRFLAVLGRFCRFWPCPSHILENKGKPPNFRSHVWFSPGLIRIRTRKPMAKIVLLHGLAESN